MVSKQHVLLFKNGQKQKIVVVTSFLDDEKLYPVIEAGATSYLLKTSRASDIADAVRATYDGETVLEPKVTGKMMSRMRQKKEQPLHDDLTEREFEIFVINCRGKKVIKRLRTSYLLH